MGKSSVKAKSPTPSTDTELAVQEALSWLRETASSGVRDGMARFGIPCGKALGVPVGTVQAFAKSLGRDAALSNALWDTDVYEARHLAIFTGDPARVTPEQMDRWCADFDNWALCDAACFHLFDRVPHAFQKVTAWAEETGEFQKRAAFALLASLALHHKKASDAEFLDGLPLIEAAADDDRNFVKKAVNWALRSIGSRNPALHAEALTVSRRLAASGIPSARWIGRDALRQLSSAATLRRIAPKNKPARE
ncbi:MAG: DNA alkylation repair protein [Verrucomicrobiota bacterium]